MHYKWWQNAITKKICTHRKLQKKILYLGLRLWRVLFRIGLLGLRFKLCILDLGDHIPNGKGILGGFGLFLIHSSPF